MNPLRTLSALSLVVLLAVSVRAAEPDRYLPDDTAMVVTVNIKQALDSPLGKTHIVPIVQGRLGRRAEVAEGLTALGLDPLKDFDSLTLATSGVASTDPQKEASKLTLIAHGSFDLTKLHATA